MRTLTAVLLITAAAFCQAPPQASVATKPAATVPEPPKPIAKVDYLELELIQAKGKDLNNQIMNLQRDIQELNRQYQAKLDEICKVAGIVIPDGKRSPDCIVNPPGAEGQPWTTSKRELSKGQPPHPPAANQ